jgi:hypothetical protein
MRDADPVCVVTNKSDDDVVPEGVTVFGVKSLLRRCRDVSGDDLGDEEQVPEPVFMNVRFGRKLSGYIFAL